MASLGEQVLQRLRTVVQAALPNADVRRNADRPVEVAPGGTVILHDGDPGDPDIILSPYAETYEHEAELDVAAYESASQTREEVVDAMVEAIRAAIAADRTLGGLCEWANAPRPVTDDASSAGTEPVRWARFLVTCVYTI